MKLHDKVAIMACNRVKLKDKEQIKSLVDRYSSGKPMSVKKEMYEKLLKHRYMKKTEHYFIAISEDYINRTEISAIIERCNNESKNIDKNIFIT